MNEITKKTIKEMGEFDLVLKVKATNKNDDLHKRFPYCAILDYKNDDGSLGGFGGIKTFDNLLKDIKSYIERIDITPNINCIKCGTKVEVTIDGILCVSCAKEIAEIYYKELENKQ